MKGKNESKKNTEVLKNTTNFTECVNDDYIIFANNKKGLIYKNNIVIEPIYDDIKCEFDSPKFDVFYLTRSGLVGVVIYYNGENIFYIEPQYHSLFQTSIPFIYIAEISKNLPNKLLLICNIESGKAETYQFNSVIEINTAINSNDYFCCGISNNETKIFYENSLFSFDYTDYKINQFNIASVDIDEIKNGISSLLKNRFEVVNTY